MEIETKPKEVPPSFYFSPIYAEKVQMLENKDKEILITTGCEHFITDIFLNQ